MLYRKDVSVLKLFNRLVMNDNRDNLGQQFGAFFKGSKWSEKFGQEIFA